MRQPVSDCSAPGRGAACVAWLDERLLARPAAVAADDEDRTWLETAVLGRAQGALTGLDPSGLDDAMFDALRAAGAPLAVDGEVRWGRDLVRDETASGPRIDGERLLLPPPERLAACSGVELLPLRTWFARHTGLRLQAAPRIACYCWANQAVLASLRVERLAGFLHGPGPDRRHPVAWEPGQAVVVRW